MRARLPRRWHPESRTKTALWVVLGIGALASVTVGSVWASYSSQTDNTGGTVATGVLVLKNTANSASTTLTAAITSTSSTSISVLGFSGFPSAASYTIQIDSEQMTVTGGQGTNTWTVIRGVNGTTAATHLNGAAVVTAACSSSGSGSSNNVNTACDSLLGYSSSTENYPGTAISRTVQLAAGGALGASDLETWMPSCLRGVTADASWASKTTTVSSFSGAATTGGFLVGGVTYYYEITAVVGGTEQVAGTEASYTVPLGSPNTSTNTVTLNWPSVSGETGGYKIYRSTIEGDEQLLDSVGHGVTTYNDTTSTTPTGFPPLGVGSGDPCFTPRTTQLSTGITNSQTSITVSSHTGFPTTGNYTIIVDNEQMTVTGGQGTNTWTVTRGANSTTAVSHSSSEPVELLDRATTLNGSLTAGATTLTVSSNAGFPTDPNTSFRILVYNPDFSNVEYMTVTAGQGTNTWTVTRGVGGTSGSTKTNAAIVELADDAQFYLQEDNSDASAKQCFYPAVGTVLSGSINNSATSITVSSPAGFPSSGSYGIIVGSEEMQVTAGAGTTTWTVTRGYKGTTAVWHPSGAIVYASSCGFDPVSDLGYFAGNYNALLQAIDLGSGPAAAATRYFETQYEFPSYASNALQGTEALFTLRWHAQS